MLKNFSDRLFLFNFIAVLVLIQPSYQDLYMQNPRGSNNRLAEKSAARQNGNRIFDSQNNDRGGYNVGDALKTGFTRETEQYQMRYFQSGTTGSTYLDIEWTSQHGCGADEKMEGEQKNCLVVLQYMCQTKDVTDLDTVNRLRDGTTGETQEHRRMGNNVNEDTERAFLDRKTRSVRAERALQESFEHYDNCYYRNRNAGLFTADQNLKNNEKGYSSAIFTRQNANGDRSGYECPEERDYYPYWHPNGGWKDIAVLTNDDSMCEYYKKESFNVKPKSQCIEFYPTGTRAQKHLSRWNNRADCLRNKGRWTDLYNYLEKAPQYTTLESCEANPNHKWATPYDSADVFTRECLVLLKEPDCKEVVYTRANHLGNTEEGTPYHYKWAIPRFPSNKLQKCVIRMRYNISTEDYDPMETDSSDNKENSPIKTNPNVNVGGHTVRLAINTAQYGRVFQDRSHSFFLMGRSSDIGNAAVVHNLNVKGKRGNIVQTFPATEYDFIPKDLDVTPNDIIHLQWTGSNTHNNGNPGGDGQTGDAGQGRGGTDRSNFVQIGDLNENYPLSYEESDLWKNVDIIGFLNGQSGSNLTNDVRSYIRKNGPSSDPRLDLAIYLSSNSYYHCVSTRTCAQSFEAKTALDVDLNEAPASLPGALIRVRKSNTTFMYMASRNNAFSNRNQLGTIRVH